MSIQKDQDLAATLGISPITLRQWRHAERVNFQVIIDKCVESKLNLELVLNDGINEFPSNEKRFEYIPEEEIYEIYEIDESVPVSSAFTGYKPNSVIKLSIPDYEYSPLLRYWVVPDNRMDTIAGQGDIIVFKKSLHTITEGEPALFGTEIRLERNGTIEYIEELILGRSYPYTHPWKAYSLNEGKMRIRFDNPMFPEIIPYSIKTVFQIELIIKRY